MKIVFLGVYRYAHCWMPIAGHTQILIQISSWCSVNMALSLKFWCSLRRFRSNMATVTSESIHFWGDPIGAWKYGCQTTGRSGLFHISQVKKAEGEEWWNSAGTPGLKESVLSDPKYVHSNICWPSHGQTQCNTIWRSEVCPKMNFTRIPEPTVWYVDGIVADQAIDSL